MEFLQARWGCKNPSPRCRRTTGRRIKMVGVRRRKDAGEWRSASRRRVGTEWGGDAGGGSMCHPHILAALLLINFSHDHLQSQYIKHEGPGGVGYLYTFIRAAIWHYFTCYVEMPIALLICLPSPSWPLLYVFDEGLPIMCPFVTLI